MMKTLALVSASILFAANLFAVDRPSGHKTPEGIACDAVQAYADGDSEAWLKTLIRPIFGEEGNQQYEDFKKQMVKLTDENKNKNKDGFVAPRIVKVFKARDFSRNGPGSMAFALHEITGNKFVDIVLDVGEGKLQNIRYHVMFDKDEKWYFEPRPDLAALLAMGLNDEAPSKDVLWELTDNEKSGGEQSDVSDPLPDE